MRVWDLTFHKFFQLLAFIRSVAINNFNLLDTALRPFETKPPMLIDSNAVLTFPVFLHGFKFVLWRTF